MGTIEPPKVWVVENLGTVGRKKVVVNGGQKINVMKEWQVTLFDGGLIIYYKYTFFLKSFLGNFRAFKDFSRSGRLPWFCLGGVTDFGVLVLCYLKDDLRCK